MSKKNTVLFWIKGVLWFGAFIGMWTHLGHPTLPLVLKSLPIFEGCGAAVLIIIPLLKSAMEIRFADGFRNIGFTLFRGILLYSLGVWFITQAGDTLARYITAHPERAITLGIAIVVLFALNWINDLFSGNTPESNAYPAKDGFTRAYARTHTPTTQHDAQRTAAHEAGHALTLAALGRNGIPDVTTVTVFPFITDAGKIGNLHLQFYGDNVLKSKLFMEWFLLMLLAGQAGEISRYEASTGNNSDYELWFFYAQQLLTNQYHGLYVLHPFTQAAAQENRKVLQAFLDQQQTMIREFIRMNESAHRALTDALLQKRTLSKSELMPFLESVQFPEGFPLPFQEN